MIHYSRILQTGLQSLLAVAAGWGCGRWRVVPEPEACVQHVNTLVLRFCIPCLQVWLLAFKTDMQQGDNWRALAAFLLWSLGLQALLASHQAATRQRLQLDRLGVEGLILTTNNTGILGPVVLEAAVGAAYAPLGMLATVVLYFQQLPLAQLLFQLHQWQQQPSAAAAGPQGNRLQKVSTSPLPGSDDDDAGASSEQHGVQQVGCELQAAGNGFSAASRPASLQHLHHHHQQQQQHADVEQQAAGSLESQPLMHQQQAQRHAAAAGQPDSLASYVLELLLKNPLVWSTGVAVLLSAAGSAALLDPSSPRAIRQLAFLEALLGWFAQTTAPLTLFTTGLWMFTNSAAQSSPAAARPAKPAGAAASAAACAAHGASGFGSTSVCPRQVGRYLLLRATVAPGLMVGICWALGFRGDLAHALVILALLPVAQTAFVVCKQAETGMAAVSSLLVASLLVMLPQLMLVLALLEGLGVFAASA